MLFTLCCLINFDSVLKYAFWIRYPSKSGRPAVLNNNLTAPFETSHQYWHHSQRCQYCARGYPSGDSGGLLFRMRRMVQNKKWVSTIHVKMD